MHGRPRVLQIITRLAVSGVSTHVTLANQELTRRGWETLLVHGRVQPDELEIDLPIPDVEMRRVETLARPVDPIADTRTLASLLHVVRTFQPDIIHTHHSKAGLLGRSVAILRPRSACPHLPWTRIRGVLWAAHLRGHRHGRARPCDSWVTCIAIRPAPAR